MRKKIAERLTAFIEWFYRPPFSKIMTRQIFRYAACGGMNVFLNLLLYALFYNVILKKQILHLGPIAISPHIASFLLVFPITFFTGFWLNRNVSFPNSTLREFTQLCRYLPSVLLTIAINYFGLKLLVEVFYLYPTPSQAIVLSVNIVLSFLMQKYFAFRGSSDDKK